MPASVEAESIWRDIGKARTEKVSLLSAMQVKLMVSILLEAVEQWWRGGGEQAPCLSGMQYSTHFVRMPQMQHSMLAYKSALTGPLSLKQLSYSWLMVSSLCV